MALILGSTAEEILWNSREEVSTPFVIHHEGHGSRSSKNPKTQEKVMRCFIQNLIAATVIAGGLGGFPNSSSACDTRCYWKTVTVYVDQPQEYVRHITRYDHCGRPYAVEVVGHRTVRVPVQRRVKICG